MSLPAATRDGTRVVALLLAGVAAFATNQSVGVTLPVHLIAEVGGSPADVGLVAAAGTVGVIAGRVVSAPLVERAGPAVLGVVSMALVVTACLGYLLVPASVTGLALVRCLHGVAFAWATTALLVAMVTMVRRVSPHRSIALANLAMPVSLALFPVIAIEGLGASLTAVAAACAVLGLGGALSYLLVRHARVPTGAVHAAAESGPVVARQLPVLLLATAALLGAADAAALEYLPVLGTVRDIDGYGWAFSVFAVGTAATLALLTALRRVVPGRRLVLAGGVVTAAALASWPSVGTLAPLLVAVGVYGAGFAVAQTGVNTAAAERSPAQRGKALATVLLAFDVGRGLGVYVIGLLIASSGFGAALLPLALLLAVAAVAGGRPRLTR